MRIRLATLILFFASIGMVAGCTSTPRPVDTWEYKLMLEGDVESYGAPDGMPVPTAGQWDRTKTCFKELGDAGWEYSGPSGDGKFLVFKRPLVTR